MIHEEDHRILSFRMMMEEARTSEMFINFLKTTPCSNLYDSHLHSMIHSLSRVAHRNNHTYIITGFPLKLLSYAGNNVLNVMTLSSITSTSICYPVRHMNDRMYIQLFFRIIPFNVIIANHKLNHCSHVNELRLSHLYH